MCSVDFEKQTIPTVFSFSSIVALVEIVVQKKNRNKKKKIIMDVLGLMQSVPYDDSIVHLEWHTHIQYASMTLKNNDEIRIPIQKMDLFFVPSMSYFMWKASYY